MTVDNFYQLHTQAVEELKEAVASELKKPDPSVEQARAIFNAGVASSGDAKTN